MVLYNVPGRTVADMLHDTVMRLAQVPGIVGIKEATGNIERASGCCAARPRASRSTRATTAPPSRLMLLGGHGNVSVTANVAPRAMSDLCAAAIAGDARRAAELQRGLMPLHRQMFCEPSPAPAKWALSRLGRCRPTVRLPLVELSEAGRGLVDTAMAECRVA
jgi:4-hydroxy-tetrahydrodipicolinate synthase